ncbi:2-oxo-hept-4-ene-1,7-dioate hydratase [Sphingomonas profundi]|uniref:2-oxo-hept-4-ene-1,7-dioate hydratase n=1 Tax=Alterirhizorhabdus profundi TaxID=2681549 RepID=UPI0012E71648|nr:2-oxo-hepta-3-ene-1,7-dioic acid hydratase [Sphingomonas profundi]
MDEADVTAMAAELDRAERDKVQIQQISERFPDMDMADAYAIQRAWMKLKLASGLKPVGRKIGLTSRAMQRSVNITEPDSGLLLDNMLFRDGHDIPTDRFIEPRVEVELAFVLSRRLEGPNVTIFDVLNATDYVVPALEIIDSRIQRVQANGRMRKVLDTISDNAANAGIVMGGRPVRPDAVDLRWVGAILYRNGVIEETGLAAGVLNHPANGPAWLAHRLHDYGEALEPGEIVLGGSFTSFVHARPGDNFHADYGPLGSISVHFA